MNRKVEQIMWKKKDYYSRPRSNQLSSAELAQKRVEAAKAALGTVNTADCLHLLEPRSGASNEYAQGMCIGLVSGIASATGCPVANVIDAFIAYLENGGWFKRVPELASRIPKPWLPLPPEVKKDRVL